MALVRTDTIDVLALAQKQPLFVPGNESDGDRYVEDISSWRDTP